MTRILWIGLGAIIAINVVVLSGAAISFARDRRRYRREMRELQALWEGEARPDVAPSLPATTTVAHHRPSRRLAGAVVAVGLLGAGAATLVSPDAREAMIAALGDVAQTLQLEGEEAPGGARDRAAAPTWQTSEVSDATAGATGSDRASREDRGVDPDRAVAAPAPVRPEAVTAEPASSSVISLSWSDVETETGYVVKRLSDPGWTTVVELPVGVTSFEDTGLAPDTNYFYQVLAVNELGVSAPSALVSATTFPQAPTAPTVTAVAASATEIVLTWTEVQDETGYRIERSPDGSSGWEIVGTTAQDVPLHTDVGLVADTRYHYRVIAVNVGGESAPSEVVSAVTGAVSTGPSPADAADAAVEQP